MPARNSKTHSLSGASASSSSVIGGIILGMVQTAGIQENRIENNGVEPGDPLCGIFILNGDNINISNNIILDNGISGVGTGENDPGDRPGLRAGIMVRFTFKATRVSRSSFLSNDGVPAVKVHDNVVVQPTGHALFILAFGPVSVVSNQFTSFDTVEKDPFSLLASTVLILNLGFSKDLMILAFKKLANKNPAYDMKNRFKEENLKKMRLLQLLPDGKVMFTGNQSMLDMRSGSDNIALSSQLIASLDDVAYNTNQSECAAMLLMLRGGFSIDRVLWDTTLIGFSVRANDNRFADGTTMNMSYSLVSYGFMNTAIGNQATHCLHVLGGKIKEIHNIILFDDKCSDKKKKYNIALNTPLYTK
ncbi:MAG TPA: hypothetical protein PKD91_13820, partial [Bacteroidia bacterium]|nr:hypothetical protein [Bacteroidia bacterium]